MGMYLSQLAYAMFAPPAHTPEVDVHSQSEIQCCTSSTVVVDESDDESAWHPKKRHQINDE